MASHWWEAPITHGYITQFEGPGTDTPHFADDMGMPMDTPLEAPLPGVVKQADYAIWDGVPGGGEVFVQPDAGGDEYYMYHLDMINVSPGQHLNAGDIIGLSGGQNSGGHHPTNPRWSSGPHLHFGWFTKYTPTPDGTLPFGPDPTPEILSLRAGHPGNPPGNNGNGGNGGQGGGSWIDQLANAFGNAFGNMFTSVITSFTGQFGTWFSGQWDIFKMWIGGEVRDFMMRGIVFIFGSVLVILGVLDLILAFVEPDLQKIAGEIGKAALAA